MFSALLDGRKKQFEDALEHCKVELSKIRTGRANPTILDSIRVDAYGSKMPVTQVASVNVPEPRLIVIAPWDRSLIAAIETAIRQGDLGVNPTNDGVVIRLSIPALNEERRQQIVKTVNQRAEESRIRVRTVREDAWKAIQEAQEAGTISEDDKFSAKDALQKTVDEYNKKIEELRAKKETEVMTV